MSDIEERADREEHEKDEFQESGDEQEQEQDVDSSEEEDDDDEEEIKRVAEGFIVDDEEEEDDVPKRKKKRRRRHRSEEPEEAEAAPVQDENALDQDDLDLLMENQGVSLDDSQRQFKRLKRANEENEGGGLDQMFSDDEDDNNDQQPRKQYQNEFDDFIEEDEFSDDERRREEERDIRSSQKRAAPLLTSQMAGLDEEKLGDMYEIFGDGEEYDWALEGEDEMEGEDEDKEPELKDVFEPGELKARLLTEEDNAIRVEDIPERYQILRQACKMDYNIENDELLAEQNWIKDKLLQERKAMLESRPELMKPFADAVGHVVQFIVRDSYEVPFIWHNRRDYIVHAESESSCETLLTKDDLWRVVRLDIEFHGILEKKKAAQRLHNELQLQTSSDFIYDDALSAATHLVDYQDLMDYLQFRYSSEIKQLKTESEIKRHSRFGRFERIRSGEVYNIVKAFGMTADELAENINTNSRINFSDDPAKAPVELAKDHLGAGSDGAGEEYTDPQQALEEAQQMLSEELFYNPRLRRTIRKSFLANAKVDIILTDKGHKKIDVTSSYYDFKYAINRSFEELRLKPELYLRMLLAESEGLVTVRVSYPNYKTTLFEEMLALFQSDNVSDTAQKWNEARRVVFKTASRKFVPFICRNIKEDLKQACLQSLYFDLRKSFGEKLNQAPYTPPQYVAGTTPRVLALSAGMGEFGKDSVLGVMMDEEGQAVGHYKFDDDPRTITAEFKNKFVEAVNDSQPDVICMAGFTVASSKLYSILQKIIDEEKLTAGETEAQIELIWAQDEVARLYQNSTRAEVEFSEYTPLVKYCIALARYVQSPILEYAALGSEISAIHIHPHQYLLPKELFDDAVETVFVDYSNMIGVDINEACRSSYVANLLPFISGLGPRKASGVLQKVQTKGGIQQRADLITEQIMGGVTFVNCASFLRIPYDKKSVKSNETEMLDATRIHPEDQEIARHMARDAFDMDEDDVSELEDRGGIIAMIKSKKNASEKLAQLDLWKFAERIQQESERRKLQTLLMIRSELLDHFAEWRKPLARLTEMQVFTMLTGETRDSLAPGSVIPVMIRKATDRFLAVRLACGIEGNVAQHYMNEPDPSVPRQVFQFGSTVQAVVKSLSYSQFTADLSTIPSEIARASRPRSNRQDPKKWDYKAEDRDNAAVRAKQENQNRSRRIIKHALFQPMNSSQAVEFLATKSDGDLVIRPSSRGIDHLAITWRVTGQIYQHLDVLEVDKPSEFTMGKFEIGGQKFSDLDELLLDYVGGLAEKVREIASNDKFRDLSKQKAEEFLNNYVESSSQSQYLFTFDHKRPGHFLLAFKISRSTPVQFWNIKVLPRGYKLVDRTYPDVVTLCNGFKAIVSGRSRR